MPHDVTIERPRDPSRPHWNDMRVPPKHLEPPQPRYAIKVEGWDTETDDGKPFIMACSQGWKPVASLEDCLSFMMGRYARGAINFWWNMRFDVDAIQKLDEDLARTLREHGEATYGDIKVSYIPKKLLKLKRKGHTCYHYDALQFYNSGLERASLRYLFRKPPAIKHDRSRLRMYALAEVGAYCQWDAIATRDLGFMLAAGMHASQIYPKHFISKGNIAKIACMTEADYSTWIDLPEAVNRIAWESFRAGWVDLWKRGTMGVWKYDINSAYPEAMRRLPNFKRGTWVREDVPEASVGFASCRVRSRLETPPFLSAWFAKTLYYPDYDSWTHCYLALSELRLLRRVADVDIEYAYSFLPDSRNDYPWRRVIDRLLERKKASKGDPAAYLVAKETVNSCYGNLVETIERDDRIVPGRLFNAAAGAFVTAECRVQVAEAVLQRPRDIIAVATDSVASTRPLRLEEGEALGQWKVEAEGETGTFIQPGIYQIAGERSHTRGFKTPDDLLSRLETDNRTITVNWSRPWSMAEALHHGDFAKANIWHDIDYELPLANARRLWLTEPASFRDLLTSRYDSVPLPISAHPRVWMASASPRRKAYANSVRSGIQPPKRGKR